MIEPGRGWAYVALFSEIGVSLLVTTLVGVLVGYWVDEQLGTLPVFLLVGFFVGAGAGTLMIVRLINRFLKTFDPPSLVAADQEDPSAAERRAPVCGASVSSEQVATPAVARDPGAAQVAARAVVALVPAHRRGHRLQHRRPDPRPAVPQGRRPGDECALPGLLHRGHARVPGAARRLGAGRSTPPPADELITFYPSISSTILTMWIVMAVVLVGVDPDGPRLASSSRARPRTCSSGSTSSSSDFGLSLAGPAAQPYIPLFAAVLPAHPVLQLERPDPAGRPDRGAARADERRQHHASAWPS